MRSLDLDPGLLILIGPGGLPRFAASNLEVRIDGHAHWLDIEGVLFDADDFGSTAEQAVGGFSFVAGVGRCHFPWRATAVAVDSDKDGWSDTAELQLGAAPDTRLSMPEHLDVPTTPLAGPDTCHDLVDNDSDGRIDEADPDCVP